MKGRFPESSLERDLVSLLEFEPRIVDFEEQPVQVAFRGENGKPRIYTPDFLVSYRPQDWDDVPIRRCLVEVKFRQELWEKWAEFRPVFKAARAYATQRGWGFKILTEVEIRKPWLRAIKFLNAYVRLPADPAIEEWIVKEVSRRFAHPRIRDLCQLACNSPAIWQDGKMLTQLWRLVATGVLCIDYKDPMTSNQCVMISELNGPLYLPLKLPGI